MNLEEIDEVEDSRLTKKSQKVDSRDEVMHVGKSDQ